MISIDQKMQNIQKNLKGIKNLVIQKQTSMIIRVLQTKKIKLTTDTFSVSRQTYLLGSKDLEKKIMLTKFFIQ